MGGQVCKNQNISIEDPLALNYCSDERESGIEHIDEIKCTNKEIQQILTTYTQNLRKDKSLYKDPSMPTDPIILKSKINQFRCTYERPYKFIDGCRKGQLYKLIDLHDSHPTTIEVKDQVLQYFGVFLCFLADKPILIQKIICTSENTYGLHCIEAYRNGRLVNFFVDDNILCKQSQSWAKVQPVFSQPQKNMYMWPCILEKAWFKIKGNSAKRVQQNSPQQIFQHFLPLPIQKCVFQQGINSMTKYSVNELFVDFDGAGKEKGYIFKSKRNPEHDIGLSGSKYFYLLDTFIYDSKRMFYLRNPCGQMHFRGMHDQLDPHLQNFINKRKLIMNAPGNFLIDEEELIEQIAQILIINYLPGNRISTFNFTFENQEQFFLGFDLKYKGLFNLCVTQNAIQKYNKSKNYYPLIYHVIRLVDMKLVGGNENKQGCFGSKNTYLLDKFNQDSVSSKYIIRLKKKINGQVPNNQLYLISYYMQNIKFQIPSQYQLQQKWKDFLKAQGKRQMNLSQNLKNQKSADIAHVVCWIGDIAYLYIQKRSKKQQISIEVNFPELMNLHCISHPQIRRSNQWNTYKFSQNFLIIFEKIDLTAETHIRQYHLQAY